MSAVHRFRSMGCGAVVAGGDPAAVAAVLERWENAFSLFRGESELSHVNRSPAHALAVSPLFAQGLQVALDVAAETDGLVDPTLGHGLGQVRLAGRALMRPPGLALDLNGVVKSLAVDDAVATLEGRGFISVGGDLAVCGPTDVALPAGGAIRVLRGGLATSGIATRGAHLVDPRTGRSSESCWEQVTASGATCVAADVAAKVGFLLGEDGPDWLDARGVPGRFVGRDDEIVENVAWSGAARAVTACT